MRRAAVSLFSGCGGSDAGVLAAGFDVLMANDLLPYAREVYLANLPHTDYVLGDVAEIRSFPKADLLIGCYPCQGFSQAGARQADRKINYLYREFDRALRKIRPKAFVVENVSGMRRADFRHLLNNQLVRFRSAGYRVSHAVLNAEDYGVPSGGGCLLWGSARISGCATWKDEFHWYYLSRNRYRGWDQISKTIVSHPRHLPLHPVSPRLRRIHTDRWEWEENRPARRYSYREAACLQGFSDNMVFPDTAVMRTKYKEVLRQVQFGQRVLDIVRGGFGQQGQADAVEDDAGLLAGLNQALVGDVEGRAKGPRGRYVAHGVKPPPQPLDAQFRELVWPVWIRSAPARKRGRFSRGQPMCSARPSGPR